MDRRDTLSLTVPKLADISRLQSRNIASSELRAEVNFRASETRIPKDVTKLSLANAFHVISDITIAGDFVQKRRFSIPPQHINMETLSIEDEIDINILKELQEAIKPYEQSNGHIDIDSFSDILLDLMDEYDMREILHALSELVKKIDCFSLNTLTFDDFCEHIMQQMAHKDKMMKAKLRANPQLPPKTKTTPHRDPIVQLFPLPMGSIFACSQNGTVTIWSNELKLEMIKNIGGGVTLTSKRKHPVFTSAAVLSNHGKIILTTVDLKMQFYDYGTLEPHCQISDLSSVPLRLHCHSKNLYETVIIYGDVEGCVNAIVISNTLEMLRQWKLLPKSRGTMPNVPLDTAVSSKHVKFVSWKVHSDWVEQIDYIHGMERIISCSNDSQASLVIGCMLEPTFLKMRKTTIVPEHTTHAHRSQRLMYNYRHHSQQSVFSVDKGIKCFDFSTNLNLLVTGGLDKKIRLWNIYINKRCSSILSGHFTPVIYLVISEPDERLYSISADRCIKIWDIVMESCIQSVSEKGHCLNGAFLHVCYLEKTQTLFFAMEYVLASLCFHIPILGKTGELRIPVSHKYPVTCIKYSQTFNQLISCSYDSTVKLWNFFKGECIFEFRDAHGSVPITCLAFDGSGRRVFTGAKNGTVRCWNFNTGQCLREMKAEDNSLPVTACTFLTVNQNSYLVSVGWDRHMHFFADKGPDLVKTTHAPEFTWPIKKREVHKDDITAVTQVGPHMIATASSDGAVHVYSLITGNCKMALKTKRQNVTNGSSERVILKLLFLQSRNLNSTDATLIASGPYAVFHFWSLSGTGKLMGSFPGCHALGEYICIATLDQSESYLFCGDTHGFITVWCITNYGTEEYKDMLPRRMQQWRAHTEEITGIEIIEEYKVIATSCLDCTIRLWTLRAEYIGTFGQMRCWSIFNRETYSHPLIPQDVLKYNQGLVHSVTLLNTDKHSQNVKEKKASSFTDALSFFDEFRKVNISMLQTKLQNTHKGIRLLSERNKREVPHRLGLSTHQHLRIHELSELLDVSKPQVL